MSVIDTRSVIVAIFDRFNRRDLPGGEDLVAEDFELIDVPAGLKLRGKEALRQWFEGFITAGPDAHAESDRANPVARSNKWAFSMWKKTSTF